MSQTKKPVSIHLMTAVGLMAALVFASSYISINIPTILGVSRIHFGNAFCLLSGFLLGGVPGGLAAGIGSCFFDLTNPLYINEVPLTFINKGLMGLVAGLVTVAGLRKADGEPWEVKLAREKGAGYPRYLIAAILGCLTYYVLYFLKSYFYNGLVIKGLEPAAAALALLDKIPASVFNGVIAAVAAPLLAVAIRKALKTAGLRLA